MALRTRVQLLIVCDTGNKSIRLISNASPLRKLSSVVFPYAQLFDVDHYRGEPRKTFDQALAVVDNLVEFFYHVCWANWSKDWSGFYTGSPSNYPIFHS